MGWSINHFSSNGNIIISSKKRIKSINWGCSSSSRNSNSSNSKSSNNNKNSSSSNNNKNSQKNNNKNRLENPHPALKSKYMDEKSDSS